MIREFKDKETEKVFAGQFSRKLPQNIQRTAERKLIMLHHAHYEVEKAKMALADRLEKEVQVFVAG